MNQVAITPEHDGRRAFNASVVEFDGVRWMAYRVSYTDTPDRLWIAKLGDDMRPVFCIPLEVQLADGWGAEDPRLFVHDDKLHVAWTAADYAQRPWKAIMFYGEVEFATGRCHVPVAYQPQFGFNVRNQREKNWQFFSAGGCLFAQYAPSPHRIIQLIRDQVVGEWKTNGFSWDYGKPSGGTPPIRTARGTWLTFFHSWEDHPTNERIYHVGAIEFSTVSSFEIVRVSSKPIISASAEWPLPTDRWKPLCVFPCGAIRDGDRYTVTCGVNDAGIRAFTLSEDELSLAAPRKTPVIETALVTVTRNFMLSGRLRQVGEIIEAEIHNVRKLIERRWAELYEN